MVQEPSSKILRAPVAVVGAVALVAVIAIMAWGGGDSSSSGPGPTAGGPGSDMSDYGGSSAEPGVVVAVPGGSGGSRTPGGSGGSGTNAPRAPSVPPTPEQVQPTGGSAETPTEMNAVAAWRVSGSWETHLASYQSNFPATGYRLGGKRVGASRPGGGWDVESDDPGTQASLGVLFFAPAPDDPNSTVIEYWPRF